MGRSNCFCSNVGSPVLLLLLLGSAAAHKGSNWKTLSGRAPVVIAKGGFSGAFPESSDIAYRFDGLASSRDTVLWCNVQLTKDAFGICLPKRNMDNCTTVAEIFPEGKKTYIVNGVSTTGWFSVDYKMADLKNVRLKQSVQSRGTHFDGALPIVPVEAVLSQYKASGVWLNVQQDSFYRQFNLSIRRYILSVSKRFVVDYISSTEVSFLTSISREITKTKLVFRFLDKHSIEASTNKTYGSLLKNLTFVKSFASAILVPKTYIWPITSDNYLLPHTSVVDHAHRAGLEIYAADFANDFAISYNYSYDPTLEYISFMDNGAFSVDGVLTDFPVTPSEAIGCFSNLNNSMTEPGKPLVFSHNGASGDYPDCTDKAYEKAVSDGAEIIDCPVQVTQDHIPICMSSIDLMHVTTLEKSQFAPHTINDPAVYTFNLTWDDIVKNLRPMISNPMSTHDLFRSPRNRNAGKFMKLSDFLAFAKGKNLSGIMISVENAAFMAEKLGFGVVHAVINALDESGYGKNKKTAQKVMIQSTDSSLLVKFKQETEYDLVYMIKEDVRDAAPSSLAYIKKFASAVSVSTNSIFPTSNQFLTNQTNHLVASLQSAGLPVYVYLLMNEFVSQPYDFFSDSTSQINAYVQGAKVDGVITDFPGTAHRYKLNSCVRENAPAFMQPPQPGRLLSTIDDTAQPPPAAPMPLLTDADVAEPPLPPVCNTTTALPPSHTNLRIRTDVNVLFTLLVLCVLLS